MIEIKIENLLKQIFLKLFFSWCLTFILHSKKFEEPFVHLDPILKIAPCTTHVLCFLFIRYEPPLWNNAVERGYYYYYNTRTTPTSTTIRVLPLRSCIESHLVMVSVSIV